MTDCLLLTGFEPFLDVQENPSGLVAERLDGLVLDVRSDSPGGADRVVSIHGSVLPVSFERAPGELEAALQRLPSAPVAIVSLGVHRGPEFRLEARAGARFASAQADNDGALGAAINLDGPDQRHTPFDLGQCESWLSEAGAPSTTISEDAGGYLCERVFRAGLDAGSAPALFLHVPPVEVLTVEEQVPVILGFLERLVSAAR